MDIVSQMRLLHVSCSLHFERVCWYHSVHYDLISDQCTEMLFCQVTQSYLDGWLLCLPSQVKHVPPRILVRTPLLTLLHMYNCNSPGDSPTDSPGNNPGDSPGDSPGAWPALKASVCLLQDDIIRIAGLLWRIEGDDDGSLTL